MSTIYSIGQMNQLADALEAAGYAPDDVTKLRSQPGTLKQFKSVLMGTAEVVHTIDCDANSYVPGGWNVEEHIKGGQLVWNPDEIELYLCDEQKVGSGLGNNIRSLLQGKPVLNACVLDYLLANPYLIPDEYKGKAVLFWGTIYRDSRGRLCVRYLYGGDTWSWSSIPLNRKCFNRNDPAAIAC